MRLLVKHALTMTLGIEWDESIPYSDPEMMRGGWMMRPTATG